MTGSDRAVGGSGGGSFGGGRVRGVIDAIERTPLAVPMALVTAAAAAFLAYAVPATIVARGVGLTGIAPLIALATPFGAGPRTALMLAVAAIAGVAVWWLFHQLDHPRLVAASEEEIDLFAPDADPTPVAVLPDTKPDTKPVAVPDPGPAPQLRRADAHPDAPARRPLFAASDLGVPMDDIDAALPFGRAPLFVAAPVAVAVAVAARGGQEDADGPDILLLDDSYRSAAPPTGTESIGALMARLERGLERRQQHGGYRAGADRAVPDGDLRLALDELRRMTTGR